MATIRLSDCIWITSTECAALVGRRFEGQTTPNEAGIYWMVWAHGGLIYKTRHMVFQLNGEMAQAFNDDMQSAEYEPECTF